MFVHLLQHLYQKYYRVPLQFYMVPSFLMTVEARRQNGKKTTLIPKPTDPPGVPEIPETGKCNYNKLMVLNCYIILHLQIS